MSLTIQTDTANSLVALQAPQAGQNLPWMYGLLAVAFFALALYARNWKLLLFPVIIVITGLLSYQSPASKPSFRMSMDYGTGQIRSEKLVHDSAVATEVTSASDIAAAEMQFNRGATRIALILRNGQQRFPLGDLHQQNEPEQYVVLTKIRSLIGQEAPTTNK